MGGSRHKYNVYDCNSSVQSDNSGQGDIGNIELSSMTSQEDNYNLSRITLRRHDTEQYYPDNEQFIFVGDSYSISKTQGATSEDSSFITEIGVGVSDGVGSWGSYGIDCSLFSGTLMKECQKFI